MQQIYNYLLIVACLITTYTTMACSCNSFYNYCDSPEDDSQTVSLGVVDTLYMVEYNQVMHFQIIEDIRGSHDTSIVAIYSNGGICGEDLYGFDKGDTLVLRLLPAFSNLTYATHFLAGLCTTNFINYTNGVLQMVNNSTLPRVPYSDFKAHQGDCSKLTSTEETETSGDLSIWPNPATDKIFVEGDYERYQVISMDGQLVSDGRNSASGPIDISSCSAGIYTLVIYSNKRRKVSRFVKIDN